MAASLSFTPSAPNVGTPISIVGAEFKPSTVCSISIPQQGITTEITSDAAGYFGSQDVADHAVGTLTISANPSDGETVTLGAVTYRFKDTMAAINDVQRHASVAANTLANLKKAINASGVAGTTANGADYFTGTVIHPTVAGLTLTATTLLVYARTGGTGGNSLASTETLVNGSFGGGTLTGGTAATGTDSMLIDFEEPGTYTVTATDDGTNTATTTIKVFQN